MNSAQMVSLLIQASYFAAAVLFIMGIKRMSSPVTARSGIQWAGVGMLVATVATFIEPHVIVNYYNGHILNVVLLALAIAVSTALAWYSGKRVAMTAMPQMVALYNGMGGGSAACIGASALLGAAMMGTAVVTTAGGEAHLGLSLTQKVLAVIGSLIGAISFTGSL